MDNINENDEIDENNDNEYEKKKKQAFIEIL